MRNWNGSWTRLSLLAAAALFALAPVAVAATCGVNWTNATSIGTGSALHGVAYGQGKFVAVGDTGAIITSSDGNYWTPQVTGTSDNLWSVVYGGGKFVAVGGKTTLTSTNGQNWTKVQMTNINDLRSVAYGNGVYVAVGLNASIITSPDGANWTIKYIEGVDLYGVWYNDGKFVAVAQFGLSAISVDGGDTFIVYPTGFLVNLRGITYGGGLWITVGENGTAFTSEDGMVWTLQTPHTQNHLYGVTYAAGLYIAVGKSGIIVFSQDAVTWNLASSQYQSDLYGICYGTDRFMAVGQGAALSNPCQIHKISGMVSTESGAPVPSVAMVLSGPRADSTYTDASGAYAFENLSDGAYTVTPNSGGNVFEPSFRDVTVAGADVTGVDFVQQSTVIPPVITSVVKATNPFRLKVYGSNFHPGCAVRVNGSEVTTAYKNSGLLVAKGVGPLIPKGTTVQITVINKDDGGISNSYSYTR